MVLKDIVFSVGFGTLVLFSESDCIREDIHSAPPITNRFCPSHVHREVPSGRSLMIESPLFTDVRTVTGTLASGMLNHSHIHMDNKATGFQIPGKNGSSMFVLVSEENGELCAFVDISKRSTEEQI